MSQEQISRQNAQVVAAKLGEALVSRPLLSSSPKPKSKSTPNNKRGLVSQDGPTTKKPRLVYFSLFQCVLSVRFE